MSSRADGVPDRYSGGGTLRRQRTGASAEAQVEDGQGDPWRMIRRLSTWLSTAATGTSGCRSTWPPASTTLHQRFPWLVGSAPGHWTTPEDRPRMPLTYTLVATRSP
ncbi:MAG: hypothetical protein ACLPR9_14670 [Acidimicrobiales bacterium]